MQPLDQILQEVTDFENQLSRRTFLKSAALITVLPNIELKRDDQKFLDRVAATLIPADAFSATGIIVSANVARLLSQGTPEHRAKVMRFLSWSQRAAILYGGDKVAINARGSRFVLVRKMGRTLSSLCLIAFWADERAMQLISHPEVKS